VPGGHLEAVAHPIRLAILRRLTAAAEPLGFQALAAAAGVHVNTVRPHIAALESAGVLRRARVVSGRRGRPQVRFRLRPGWTPPGRDLRELAGLLATAISERRASPRALAALGRDWGRRAARRVSAASRDGVVETVLGELGVDSRVTRDGVHLFGCPCPLVAPTHPELVCDLLVSAAEGAIQETAPRAHMRERTHDPASRRCRVVLERAASASR
jgi:predicted ArsR family transcriptional regulator